MLKGNMSKNRMLLLLAAVVFAAASRFFIRCEAVSSVLYLVTLPLILYCTRESGTVREYLTVFFAEFICGYVRHCTDFGGTFLALLGTALVCFLISVLRIFVFVADSYFIKKKECFASTLGLPLLACFVEVLLDRMAFGNILNPVTCLYSFLPVLQVTRFIPEHGLLFLLSWFFSLLVYMIRTKRFCILPSAVCILMLIMFFVPGSIILNKAPSSAGNTIRVAFVTTANIPFYDESYTEEDEDVSLYYRAVKKASDEGADLMMSVEEHLAVRRENLESVLKEISSAARDGKIYVITGIEVYNGNEKKDNMVYVFDREGNILCEYKKNFLVPFIEAPFFNKGDGRIGRFTFNTGDEDYNAAVCICFDGNSSALMKQVRNDTDILFIPAWEWNTINLDQPRNSRIIPVREGVTVIKSTQDGYDMAVDRWGRTLYKEFTVGKYKEINIVDIPIYQ